MIIFKGLRDAQPFKISKQLLSDWISGKSADFYLIGYPKSLTFVGLDIRKACRLSD